MLVFLPEDSLKIQNLADTFDSLFKESENTILQWGAAEPIYLPCDSDCLFNRVVARDDYYASALHEVSHWSIAGPARRTQVDYGYWYNGDGRNEAQQRLFEEVEVKPQALEWILSQASGLRFKISADNLDGEMGDLTRFKDKVFAQVQIYLQGTLPERAERLKEVLAEESKRQCYLAAHFFNREAI